MFVWSLCLVLSATALVSVGGEEVCPIYSSTTHPVRLHGSHCYQFHLRETKEFSAAQAECRAQGGNEVIIRDNATQQFLFQTIQEVYQITEPVWIGLNDILREGTFRWVDGSDMTFSFWADDMPSFVGEVEDCVGMDMSDGGRWKNYICEEFLFVKNPHPFICQFHLRSTGTSPSS